MEETKIGLRKQTADLLTCLSRSDADLLKNHDTRFIHCGSKQSMFD